MSRERCPIAVVDTAGNVVTGARVRIYRRNTDGSAGALASTEIFTTEDGDVEVTYPLIVDAFGRVDAWADRGSYLIDVNSSAEADLEQEPWDASPGREGAITGKALYEALRAIDALTRMEVYGHSLAFSGWPPAGASSDDRDVMTHLASMLKAREVPRSVGGAIAHWHDDANTSGGHATVARGTVKPARFGTTLSAGAAAGATAITIASGGTNLKDGDMIHIGTGVNGETAFVNGTGLTGTNIPLRTPLQSAKASGDPIWVVPTMYMSSNPLYILWLGLNDLAAAPITDPAIKRRYIEAMRYCIARCRLAEFYDAAHASVTRTGTWTIKNVGYTGVVPATGYMPPAGGSSVTLHVPANFPGGDLYAFWTASITGATGDFTSTVDGAAGPTFDITPPSDVTTGAKYNGFVMKFSNLPPGRHSIVITSPGYSGGELIFAGWGPESETPPLVVCPGFARPYTYNIWDGWTNGARDATFTSANGTQITTSAFANVVNNTAAGLAIGMTVTFANGDVRRVTGVTSATVFTIDTELSSVPAADSYVLAGVQDADIPLADQILKDLCAEYDEGGVIHVELDTAVNKNPDMFWYDTVHFNDRGHATVARRIYEEIEKAAHLTLEMASTLSVPTVPIPAPVYFFGPALTAAAGQVDPGGAGAVAQAFNNSAQWRDCRRAAFGRLQAHVAVASSGAARGRVEYWDVPSQSWRTIAKSRSGAETAIGTATDPGQIDIATLGLRDTGWFLLAPELALYREVTLRYVHGNRTAGATDPTYQFISLEFA
jgi:hypothetical protein